MGIVFSDCTYALSLDPTGDQFVNFLDLSEIAPSFQYPWEQVLSLKIMVDSDRVLFFSASNFAHSLEQELEFDVLLQLMELYCFKITGV